MADLQESSGNWLAINLTALLALIMLVGGLVMLYFHPDTEVRMAVVGMITMVLGYYFGKNAGDAKKDTTIKTLVDSQGTQGVQK